ncbi:MAG: hypothetical protein OEU51_01290 [Gammaproteobacteria bacterium]|nr:hypothetical protein [Gammaproteobacteria bacterium]
MTYQYNKLPGNDAATEHALSRTTAVLHGKRIGVLTVFTLIIFAALAADIRMVAAGPFQPPALDGFEVHSERDGDGDGDGVNETRIKQYMNQNSDSLVSMTTKGRLWAWSLDTRDDDSGIRNYVIRDSNCDGTFDEVYGLDAEFHVPECLK